MPNTDTYTPEWTREHNPTIGMSETALIAYYKAHSLAGDALFALRPGTETPQVILNGWMWILNELATRKGGKATPALKAEGKRLRTLTREWLATQPIARPMFIDESEAA